MMIEVGTVGRMIVSSIKLRGRVGFIKGTRTKEHRRLSPKHRHAQRGSVNTSCDLSTQA